MQIYRFFGGVEEGVVVDIFVGLAQKRCGWNKVTAIAVRGESGAKAFGYEPNSRGWSLADNR